MKRAAYIRFRAYRARFPMVIEGAEPPKTWHKVLAIGIHGPVMAAIVALAVAVPK